MKILDTIKKLNADASNLANQEKAKKLRKRLLTAGIILAVLGFGGAVACFALFAAFSMSFQTNYILIPLLLMIPCFIAGGIGVFCIYAGFAIILTGVSTKFIAKSLSSHCPYCNKFIEEDALFCNGCGKSFRRKCPSCQTINEPDSLYCKTCGTRLNK